VRSPRARYLGDFRWEGVPALGYKPEAGSFREVTRQVLAGAEPGLPCELRYFEVGPGGHTTLERHRHPHAVLVLRGAGRALVGAEIVALAPYDLVRVPPDTWHQFRAAEQAPLGFLCWVAAERDRPRRPDAEALRELRERAGVGEFIRP
jgi:quercetin dioxygenase-like cupin family protein